MWSRVRATKNLKSQREEAKAEPNQFMPADREIPCESSVAIGSDVQLVRRIHIVDAVYRAQESTPRGRAPESGRSGPKRECWGASNVSFRVPAEFHPGGR